MFELTSSILKLGDVTQIWIFDFFWTSGHTEPTRQWGNIQHKVTPSEGCAYSSESKSLLFQNFSSAPWSINLQFMLDSERQLTLWPFVILALKCPFTSLKLFSLQLNIWKLLPGALDLRKQRIQLKSFLWEAITKSMTHVFVKIQKGNFLMKVEGGWNTWF